VESLTLKKHPAYHLGGKEKTKKSKKASKLESRIQHRAKENERKGIDWYALYHHQSEETN